MDRNLCWHETVHRNDCEDFHSSEYKCGQKLVSIIKRGIMRLKLQVRGTRLDITFSPRETEGGSSFSFMVFTSTETVWLIGDGGRMG